MGSRRNFKRCETLFDCASKEAELRELEERMEAPDFWSNQEGARNLIRRVKYVRGIVEPVRELEREVEDLDVLEELAREENDEGTLREVEERTEALARAVDRLELASILADPEDQSDAFLSVHAGAGGTESCDWAQMLLRMYSRWAEKEGYKTELVNSLNGEEAGVRNATLRVNGPMAYGYLKGETGVHRLVRISPFDSGKRRHTSFAAVDVVPVVEDDIDIELKDSEIEIEFTRSSGPGGQNVNKVATAVRIKDLPSGIVVLCQSERSQHKNRRTAESILKAKLHQRERQKRLDALETMYDEKGEIAWGNQIRSYVLQPYQMVKDLRTEFKTGDPTAVLDGDLMPFMEAYLRFKLAEKTSKD